MNTGTQERKLLQQEKERKSETEIEATHQTRRREGCNGAKGT